MKPVKKVLLSASALVVLLMTTNANSQILFEEGLDDSAADVTINRQGAAEATFVDYSNFTLGSTNFSIVEAPRMVGGSAVTSGLLLQANTTAQGTPPAGAAEAINVLAGTSPVVFAGDYTLSFDAWINVNDNPFPTSGSTEQLLWGVGTDSTGDLEARNSRAGAVGVWGWLAGENGYGTEDAAIFVDATEAADLGDTQTGEEVPFNDAFTTNFGVNNAAANSWVEVDITKLGGTTTVKFNGVEFFSIPLAASPGNVMFGYEDPFASVSSDIENQWGLFDNFVITRVPEPTSVVLAGLCGICWASFRRRR